MAQVPGNIVSDDGTRLGKVVSVTTVKVNQPDRVTIDTATGAEISRVKQDQLDAAQLTVEWEDGTTGTLTELLDSFVNVGSIVAFPKIDNAAAPPAGAFGELPEQQTQIDSTDIKTFAEEVRAAAPLADALAESERTVEVVEDGSLSLAE